MAEWERPSLSSGGMGRPRRKPRRLRGILSGVLIVAVAGFGWVAWSAYQEGRISGGDGVVPFLRAGTEPTRIRPDDPGGMPVPNQDKAIYNEIDPRRPPPKGVERLLPPPESPVAKPSLPTLGETAPPPPPREVASIPPKAVAEPEPAPQSQAAQPAPSPFQKVEAPPAQPKRAAGASRSQMASVSPSAPAPVSGGIRVQLAAVSSESEAQKEWERVLRANRDLLGSLSPTFARADLGAKGVVYRVQAGPLTNAEAASDLCGKLKSRNVGCFVAR
jgi:cell division septation protein DedD